MATAKTPGTADDVPPPPNGGGAAEAPDEHADAKPRDKHPDGSPMSQEEIDAYWLQHVYKPNVPQLTPRAELRHLAVVEHPRGQLKVHASPGVAVLVHQGDGAVVVKGHHGGGAGVTDHLQLDAVAAGKLHRL